MKQRESRYLKVARMAYQLAQKSLPLYSHPKSKHTYTFPQLATCVLMMFYLDLSYRDMEEWLLSTDPIVNVLGLMEIPDYSTLQRTYKKLRRQSLERMKDQFLSEVGLAAEETIAIDSTGFSPSQASLHYLTRCGRHYQAWVKGAYAVGTRSQYILAWGYGRGPSSDEPYLAPLRRGAARYGCHQGGRRAWLLLADSGFESSTMQEGDIITIIWRAGKRPNPERRARGELAAQARLDGLFGQRWKTETVNSVIKRKFGSAIRSRLTRLQNREPMVKGLVYNLHRYFAAPPLPA